MKRSSKYVGLDVHQATTVSTVRDDTGRVLARTVVPTEADALMGFVAGPRCREPTLRRRIEVEHLLTEAAVNGASK